ncbi:MAG: hypothetical protein ABIK83_01025 [Candidatus Zixiibacteriota bacterium]
MQAYFDRFDAQLELETFVTRSHSGADFNAAELRNGPTWRRILNIVGLAIVLTIAGYLAAVHLGSANPPETASKPEKKISKAGFIIEIPPLEKPKPKPQPKVEPPKPKPTERLRSIPDNTMTTEKQIIVADSRDMAKENDRSVIHESTEKRALPAVQTPVVEIETDVVDRNEVSEGLRYAAVSAAADTISGFRNVVASGTTDRNLPEEGISRIKLDPYHYQMVNLCLRLCVKSMFTHSGVSQTEMDQSEQWLKIVRGSDDKFSILFKGRWIRFDVNAQEIGNISNLSFVDIPGRQVAGDEVNMLLEEVTRKLCMLLGYDNCYDKL